jgi:DNA polymerase III subunit alpha
MSRAEFVHLHNHTEYSLLNALARITDDKGNPSDLLKQIAAWKMPALALTDAGNMYGTVEF